jgi:hypothetical protein
VSNKLTFEAVLRTSDAELEDYARQLTPEELEALQMDFQNHVDALNAKRRILDPIANANVAKIEAQRLYEGLSDDQKKALAQHIQVQSVVNPRKVNGTE